MDITFGETHLLMTQLEINDKVITILKKYTRIESVWDSANGDSKILEDLKINSARLVDIMLDLEDTFDIEIDDDTMDSIITIDDAVAAITQKLS